MLWQLNWTGEVRIMRKNKLLTIWAVLVFAFLAIPLLIITVTAFGGGSAITFPIESFSLKWFANVFALKSFRRSFITSLEVAFWQLLSPFWLVFPQPMPWQDPA